jgi:hypothetical protein
MRVGGFFFKYMRGLGMDNDELRYHIIPPSKSWEWWASILDYNTALAGPNIQFAERYSNGLYRFLPEILGGSNPEPYRLLKILCRYCRSKVSQYSPEEIRDWIINSIREKDLTPVFQTPKSSINYKIALGVPLNEEDKEFSVMSVDDFDKYVKTTGISKLENMPVDIWRQIKDMILKGIDWVIENDIKTIILKMREMDLLRWCVWNTQETHGPISENDPKQWLSETNQGIIKQVEYWLGISDDSEGGIPILWNLGVRAEGRNLPWVKIKAHINSQDEKMDAVDKYQEPVMHVLDVIIDLLYKHPAPIILEWGQSDILIRRLKKATWNDKIDRNRKYYSKRAFPPQLLSIVGEHANSGMEDDFEITELDYDDTIGPNNKKKYLKFPSVEIDIIDSKIELDRLVRDSGLTRREKQILFDVHQITRDLGYLPSYRNLGYRLGISGVRVHQIFKSISAKFSRQRL